jgi:hypothetical protein
MDEKPDQIIGHIEAQREELGRNLNELETRVRRSTDWRTYFERNPMAMLGAALGGGVLLGSLVANRRSLPRRKWKSGGTGYGSSTAAGSGAMMAGFASTESSGTSFQQKPRSAHKAKVTDTLEQVKGALVAFGISKAKEFLSQAMPGFDRHLSEVEQQRQRQASGSSYSYPGSHSESEDFRTHMETGRYRGSRASEYGSSEPVGAGSMPNNP